LLTLLSAARQLARPVSFPKGATPVKELELASMMVSRVCHDLISPVGALSNGVEVLVDETDPVMRDHAIALIANSAQGAAAKLKLCRLAYGSMGSAGDQLSLSDARDALEGFLKGSKTKLDWRAPAMLLPKDTVKLVVNLAISGMDTIPRGGVLRVTADETPDGVTLVAACEGPMPRVTDELRMALAGEYQLSEIDMRRVQPFFTGMMARSLGGAVNIGEDGAAITLSAFVPRAQSEVAAA
jgi:histidine phosphotransferase ChpT